VGVHPNICLRERGGECFRREKREKGEVAIARGTIYNPKMKGKGERNLGKRKEGRGNDRGGKKDHFLPREGGRRGISLHVRKREN